VIARRALLTGRVQGVFFRAHVQEEARRRGVSGWAANRPDGAVEIHVQGDPAAVEEVLDAARSGPPGARVEAVDVREAEPEDVDGFEPR
jgi:acylphosphatase